MDDFDIHFPEGKIAAALSLLEQASGHARPLTMMYIQHSLSPLDMTSILRIRRQSLGLYVKDFITYNSTFLYMRYVSMVVSF